MPDGWFKTGDLGHYNEQNRWFVSNRIQDLIFSPGQSTKYVLATDLESTLLDVAGTIDAEVTSVQLPPSAEKTPRGFVVLDELDFTTKEEVSDQFNSKVELLERLTGDIFVVKEIPKLPGGKGS